MRFSQRRKLTPIRIDIQRDGMDDALRNKLWNALYLSVLSAGGDAFARHGEEPDLIASRLWLHFFNNPFDEKPAGGLAGLVGYVKWWFSRAKWHEVYDLVEAVAQELKAPHLEEFTDLVNSFLGDEQSAYRLVDRHIADITSEQEIQAIEDAAADASPLAAVRAHLESALTKLTDRKSPDYRNSIKESISAVEAMCQALTADPNATLGQALKRLKDAGLPLHPALEQAWSKLYGYTSDANGIRHALTDEPAVTHGDAKYMLVSCSAFVSHLTGLAAGAGVALKSPK